LSRPRFDGGLQSRILSWRQTRREPSRRDRGVRGAGDRTHKSRLETFIKPIQAALYRRRYGMKNRERLNRLLLLLQLEANGHANERRYAKDIRDWLEHSGGRPATPRRAIVDPTDRPSLRDPGARLAPARTRRGTRSSDEITPARWDDLAQ